jgi:hypothetical protein
MTNIRANEAEVLGDECRVGVENRLNRKSKSTTIRSGSTAPLSEGGTPAQGGAISDRPAHEVTMRSGSPSLIGSPWSSAERRPPLLWVKAARRPKEGRYLIAQRSLATQGKC